MNWSRSEEVGIQAGVAKRPTGFSDEAANCASRAQWPVLAGAVVQALKRERLTSASTCHWP